MDLRPQILSLIEQGEESERVEFKATVELDDRAKRGEFARDVSALANTEGDRERYLIVGVVDAKSRGAAGASDTSGWVGGSGTTGDRRTLGVEQRIVGFPCPDPDKFRRDVAKVLSFYCDPPPKVEVCFGTHPNTGKTLAAVVVARSFARPHAIKRGGPDLEAEDIWVRRGPACARANRHEIEEMVLGQQQVIILNFSSHPLPQPQVRRVGLEMNCRIQEVIERPWTLSYGRPFAEQAREMADSLGLTPHTWQEAPIVVCPPGLAAATAVLMAELHGRMGHFPSVVVMRPVRGAAVVFEIGEVINLHAVRTEGRGLR